MTGLEQLALIAAGVAAGTINSVAGGGSLVSFPALVAVGLSPLSANVTNMVAVTPGYLTGTLAYREELRGQRRRARRLGLASGLGAVAGTAVLLRALASAFDAVVPFLVLLACGLLLVQDRLRPPDGGGGDREDGPVLALLTFAGGIYGGYFGAGLGIMLLALLGACLDDDLQRLNALKGLLSLVVSLAAAAGVIVFGPVDWASCALVAAGALVGGRLGVHVARRLPARVLRAVVATYGVGVAVVLLVR